MPNDNVSQIEKIRHSTAHLLAQAVKELYPKTILTIGPPTKDGFFYDFLPETNFKDEDLPKITQRMKEIAERNIPLTHKQIPKEDARKLYKDNPYKLELIDLIPGDTVGLAEQGDFSDLCKGGHVTSTGELKNFKLLHISGSYWRADRNGQPLQRITGTAFATPKELRLYEKRVEEAQKYDHRKLGKQLDLFSFVQEGPGFPFFHPKGQKVIQLLKDDLRTMLDKQHYQEIATPIILSDELWKQSGHYEHYKDNMFFSVIDKQQYAVKPMNCPGAIMVYKDHPRSYRELPLKLSEFGLVHRYELSGVLHGLFRVRSFTQDDGHIFCTPNQVENEVLDTIKAIEKTLKKFGFDNITVGLSTKPENAMGTDEYWQQATTALQNALDRSGLKYTIQEGEGAFYGPKIEFGIQDSMGRSWQCSTIQLDFFLPQNFDLSYIASSGKKERPVMIHRAIYGSMERFFGILLEHFKGNLPFWLAPIQVKLLTITDDQKEYAHNIMQQLQKHNIRVAMDETSDPISGKIKTAQLEKVPWMLVMGQKEMDNHTITLRYRNGKQEFGLSLDDVLAKAQTYNDGCII
ncbi:MAG: threonine--tRNA ligase [Candidatus Dependentiae bacterium]